MRCEEYLSSHPSLKIRLGSTLGADPRIADVLCDPGAGSAVILKTDIIFSERGEIMPIILPDGRKKVFLIGMGRGISSF